jgi:YVTN family beta-propeller protein
MKTTKLLQSILVAAFAATLMTSCDPKQDVVVTTNPIINTGMYILNEGSYQSNNASINYFDLSTQFVTADVFTAKNNRSLGDTGQDMIKYGSKIYISVYGSSLIEVIDAKTAVSIKSIPILDIVPGSKSYPRYFAVANGKVYVTLFDKTYGNAGKGNVAMLDTTSLTITKTLAVGSYPEGCAIVNNKLYVANSGGLATVKDSTVSVIDLNTFTETKKIKVGLNPGSVKADNYGDVYVIARGNYQSIKSLVSKINSSTDTITALANVKASFMTIVGDKAYMYYSEYDASYNVINKQFAVYDVKNDPATTTSFISADLIKTNTYCIDVDPTTNLVYIGETDYNNNGTMHCYNQLGVEQYKFTTGISPSKIIFLSK